MSSPGLRERKKQKTRWSIQEHALRLIREQGYEQTTIDQIAEAAEISPSTFFRYFKTKEDVVLEDDYDPLIMRSFQAAPADLGPVAALRHGLREAWGEIGADEMDGLRERTKLMMSVPALRMRSLDNFTGQIDLVAQAVGARTGRPASDFGVRTLAGALLGTMLVAVLEWGAQDRDEPLDELVDRALGHLESGFAG